MCGIVGYTGRDNARDIIIDGLKKLEYRGYDSAGIALLIDGKIEIKKHVGGIENLDNLIVVQNLYSHTGIGHTSWATHGAPSDINAHPHASEDGKVAIVHNGIIENFVELKEELIEKHHVHFKSETDSEVVAHLISLYMKECDCLEGAV